MSWQWLKDALSMPGRVWTAGIAAAPPRVWAIMLGAPPLCAMAAWIIHILAGLATQGEPVRVPVVDHIAHMGYIVLAIVAIIVAALAAVGIKAQGPGGLGLEIGDSDDLPQTKIVTTTETVVTPPAPSAQQEH